MITWVSAKNLLQEEWVLHTEVYLFYFVLLLSHHQGSPGLPDEVHLDKYNWKTHLKCRIFEIIIHNPSKCCSLSPGLLLHLAPGIVRVCGG